MLRTNSLVWLGIHGNLAYLDIRESGQHNVSLSFRKYVFALADTVVQAVLICWWNVFTSGVFICNTFVKYAACKTCRKLYLKKGYVLHQQCHEKELYTIVEKFWMTFSELDKSKIWKHILSEEKLDDDGTSLQEYPTITCQSVWLFKVECQGL